MQQEANSIQGGQYTQTETRLFYKPKNDTRFAHSVT
jgi:hypothetical protein